MNAFNRNDDPMQALSEIEPKADLLNMWKKNLLEKTDKNKEQASEEQVEHPKPVKARLSWFYPSVILANLFVFAVLFFAIPIKQVESHAALIKFELEQNRTQLLEKLAAMDWVKQTDLAIGPYISNRHGSRMVAMVLPGGSETWKDRSREMVHLPGIDRITVTPVLSQNKVSLFSLMFNKKSSADEGLPEDIKSIAHTQLNELYPNQAWQYIQLADNPEASRVFYSVLQELMPEDISSGDVEKPMSSPARLNPGRLMHTVRGE